MSERPVPRWRKWLWKIPLYVALASVVGALGFVWLQHGDMVRQQDELRLIDTQPHVRATFDRYDPGERGTSGRAWVLVRGESKELAELWGVARVAPGQSITVVVVPGTPGRVVPVYVRDDLANQFRRYPLMLDDSQMWAYQLTMPLTWMAGAMFGVIMVALAALRERLWNRSPWVRQPESEPADGPSRRLSAGPSANQGTSRRTHLGVMALVFAAGIGFLMVVTADRANPWGMTAGTIAFLTLAVSGINDLIRRPHPAVRKATNVGYVISSVIVVGWSQVRPDDLVSSRMPSAMSVRIAGIVLGILILVPAGWVLAKRLRSRTVSRAMPTSFVGRAPFAFTRRGYDTVGVDDLLARLAALPDTPEGRSQARAQVAAARFHLVRGSAYEPLQVDRYLDRLVEEPAEIAKPMSPTPAPSAESPTGEPDESVGSHEGSS